MPIIINEFEVVTEPPQPTRAGTPEREAAEAPARPEQPQALANLLRRLARRAARLQAD
jgi:hypothetical protein